MFVIASKASNKVLTLASGSYIHLTMEAYIIRKVFFWSLDRALNHERLYNFTPLQIKNQEIWYIKKLFDI